MSGNTKDRVAVRNNTGKTTSAATAPTANAYANATVLEKIENLVATYRHGKRTKTMSYEFRNALDSSSSGDFMTQTTPGAFALIENMVSSSLNKNKENDRSKSVNSIDDLAAKVDQLIKGNHSQVFIMEETASENSALDVSPDAENAVDDQQEVSYVTGQGWQYKNIHPNPNIRNNTHLFAYLKPDKPVDNAQNSQGQNNGYQKGYQGRTYVLSQAQHNQFQNQKQQTAQQAAPAPMAAPTKEIKGLATMIQQLLQGQQIQGKALNQVTTDINSRMNHMFNDLSTKYDNVASHMRQMDIQIAQTAESVKRQQGTLPGKIDKNPKEYNAVALKSGGPLPDTDPKKLSAAEKGKEKEGEKPQSKDVPLSDEDTEQPAETDTTPATTHVEHVPLREYTPKVPYPVPAKNSRNDREEMKCLSNGESSRADRLLVLLGCMSASSSVSLESLLRSKLTCSTPSTFVSLAGGLSSGVVKSSFLPWIFVDPRGRTARVLAVKVSTFFVKLSCLVELLVAES
ncbi:hypothetical protein F2Q69_00042247 [Brassica cretica]|uniref:Uncharacterized protein n=1 Tax=Brassica cretica TaxID=69181 RepID=A0A8S9NSM0_BRACR|nr:hypothetical protein F2Q69_00042247 [Brassica cretica]